MRKALAISLCLSLFASISMASNTGFKIHFDLEYFSTSGLTNLNYVSFPYSYFPDGDVTNTSPTARDVCHDLNNTPLDNDPIVIEIQRFNPSSSTFTKKLCNNATSGFPIVKGIGYAIVPNPLISPNPKVITLIGTHDDQYASNKTVGFTPITLTFFTTPGLSNYNYLSVPYHWQPDPQQTGGPSDNAKGLCWTVNGNAAGDALVTTILRWNPSANTFTTKACASPAAGFDVIPGQSYAFIPNQSASPVDVSFAVN